MSRQDNPRKAKKGGDSAAADLAMLIEGEMRREKLDEVLAKFGRSRSSYYDKRERFRGEGFDGLCAHPTGPHAPWRRTEDVEQLIVAMRTRDPTASAASIAHDLLLIGRKISPRSVERTLKRFGLTRPSRR